MLQHGVHGLGAEHARADGELLQPFGILSKRRHSEVGDLPAAAELEAREVPAPDGDQDQRIVVDADRFPVTSERELRHRIEPSEYARNERQDSGLRVQGETVAVLAVDAEPALADEGASFPVAGAEKMENDPQALVGEIQSVVAAVDGVRTVRFVVVLVRR